MISKGFTLDKLSWSSKQIQALSFGIAGILLIKKASFTDLQNAQKLTSNEVLEINQRKEMVVVGYMGGNEGASMLGGLYLVNYLIFSVVNGNKEIIDLLKRVKLTIVPVLNVEALVYKSQ